MRCCAQRFGPRVPPIFYSGEAKITKLRNSMQIHKTLFLWNGSAKVELWCRRELKFNVFLIFFAKKKLQKMCQRKLPKLSSRSNQSSTFAIWGGFKMSLQKHSERQHDFNIFPKTRQDFTKKSQKFKVSRFSLEQALTCPQNNAKRFYH